MKRLPLSALLACAMALPSVAGDAFRISRDSLPVIYVQHGLRAFVTRAARDLAGDMEKIFGRAPEIVTEDRSENVIRIVRDGEGWETYALTSASQNVLTISGSDDRGAMFGIYRFCSDFLGVDPYYWWSGIEPRKADEKKWDDIDIEQGEASFKYRGWFVNDEDFLNGFRPAENGRRQIDYARYHVVFGPKLGDRIYEAAVRAGFNTMICASYVDIMNPDEKALIDTASARGLYITMHHQEPVGASGWLWKARCDKMGLRKPTTYAEDPEGMRAFWREYIRTWAKIPDVIWQIGLRGIGDRPFWMRGESWGESGETEHENRHRAELISQAMNEQMKIISAALGKRPKRIATQLWMEGAELYEKGMLNIPKGVTVLYSDNCPGWKFQKDIGERKTLSYDHQFGAYYHLAVVHGNHRTECVPPARTHQVLSDIHGKGVSEMIIVNVSNVRPILYTLDAMGMMLRDLKGFSADAHAKEWIARHFSANRDVLERALTLYFNAYELIPSRDESSSYGSPIYQRAPLAAFNDGILYSLTSGLLADLHLGVCKEEKVVSHAIRDPLALAPQDGDIRQRTVADMFPLLVSRRASICRAQAQVAGFERAAMELEMAKEPLPDDEKTFLFDRFEYPIRSMLYATRMYVCAASAVEAKMAGNIDAAKRYVAEGRAAAEKRDALDRRWASGRWKGWLDRDIIYPYPVLTKRFVMPE